jgi:hypothetical protein
MWSSAALRVPGWTIRGAVNTLRQSSSYTAALRWQIRTRVFSLEGRCGLPRGNIDAAGAKLSQFAVPPDIRYLLTFQRQRASRRWPDVLLRQTATRWNIPHKPDAEQGTLRNPSKTFAPPKEPR